MSDHVAVTDPTCEHEAKLRVREIASRQAAAAARLHQERREAVAAMETAELQARLNAIADRARELEALATPEEVRQRDPRRIMTETARRFGLTLRDITGPSRLARHVNARWAAIHAVRAVNPSLSMKKLGRHFGNRDATAIINAIRKMEREGVPQPPASLTMGDAR